MTPYNSEIFGPSCSTSEEEESRRPVARAFHRSAGSHIREKKSAQRDLDGEFRERVAASGDLGCAH